MIAWMPREAWLHRANRVSLKQDAVAGLTGALVVLPQGIGYVAIAGLPPEFGLYCAIGPAAIVALFGSSWQLVCGPTAPISIVVFSALAPLAKPKSADYNVRLRNLFHEHLGDSESLDCREGPPRRSGQVRRNKHFNY